MDLLFLFLFIISRALLHQQAQASAANSTIGFSLKLIHRDSIHSPLYQGNLTADEESQQRHLRYSQLLNISTHPVDTSMIRPRIRQFFLQYTVELFIGTPASKSPLHLLLDTGTDLTWTQTHPCEKCFNQDPPLYSHIDSTTHSFVNCFTQDSACLARHKCENDNCIFTEKYLDGAETTGYVSKDTFAFDTSGGGGRLIIPGLVFGASYECNDLMTFEKPSIAGIMGLGTGPDSLAVQLSELIGGRFSYCLVKPGSPEHSYLQFGSNIPLMPTNAQSTAFLPRDGSTNYYLDLIDLSFDGQRLCLDPGVFWSAGTIIDSGSEFSKLVQPAYDVLRQRMVGYFQQFELVQVSPIHGLDLCYKMPKGFNDLPTVTLHFGDGANLHLKPENVFLAFNNYAFFCSGFFPDESKTIIGAFQQMDTRFTYDLLQKRLEFAPEVCDKKDK